MQNDVSNCDEKFCADEYDFEESYYTYEEQKCLQIFYETIHEVLVHYNDIIMQFTQHAYYCPTSHSLHKNKFEKIRKHLFKFLYMHKHFLKFKAIFFNFNGTNIRKKVRFCYLDDSSKLFDFNSYLKILRKMKKIFGDTSIEDLKQKYTITLKVNYKRKKTLQALKKFFKEEALSEESMTKLCGDYFIGKKSLKKTYKITSYKKLLGYLKDYYSENDRTVKLINHIIEITNTYTCFLSEITKAGHDSNDFNLHVRKFNEVLKELYEFAVAHKSIIEFKNVYISHSSKTKFEFSKVDFDYSKNGLNFLSLDSLYQLNVEIYFCYERFCKTVCIDSSFVFNNRNLKKLISSSTKKKVNSVEELERLCYDAFLGNTTPHKNQKFSSYKELKKALAERENAFWEGKVSRTYFNQLCSTYEGSTDENGEILKCNICLDELEIGAEVCRLPCGHLNCKTCIEGWFDLRTERFLPKVEDPYKISEENGSCILIDNSDVDSCSEVSNENSDSKGAVHSEFSESEVPESEIQESKTPDSETPTLEKNNDAPPSDVYWNEYVVDDNEKQKSRNQCPTCKHICS